MYRLTLLGGVLLEGPDGPVSGRATQQRRLALLALVGSAGDRGRSRDQLIALLWPETDPSTARQHLSHALYSLRRTLGENAIRSAGQYVRLSAAHFFVDSVALEAALESGDLAAASAVYRGPFLDGFFVEGAPEFERWAEEERRRLERRYLDAVEAAARDADAAADPAGSVKWWGRLVECDPYNSAAVLSLMEALRAAGDPANAVLAGREHAERLSKDLDIAPPEAIGLLSEAIQRDPSPRPERPGAHGGVVDPGRADESGSAEAEGRGFPRRHTAWTVIAAAAVLVGVLLLRVNRGPLSMAPAQSVAVIPFLNLTGDSTHEYLVDHVTDQVIATLARVPDLRVPAQTSSFHFKGRPLDVRAIADSLHVGTIVEGSVGTGPGGFLITAQLVDAETGYHLWAETFDRSRNQLPGLQDEITAGVLAALGMEVAAQAPSGARTGVPAAWDDYGKARYWWRKRTMAGTDTAIIYFREAVEADPGWALAWSGLADSHTTGMFWGHLAVTDSTRAELLGMADRAMGLDSSLAEVQTSFAAANSAYGDLPTEQAIQYYRRALELNPNYAVAHQWLGEDLFMRLGRGEEGIAELRKAYELDPLSPIIIRVLADFLWASPGGALEALRFYEMAVQLEPGQWASHSNLAAALACLGREAEARQALREVLDLGRESTRALIDAVIVLGILRDYDSASVLIDRIREHPNPVEYTDDIRALLAREAISIYVEMGRYDEAMAEYRTASDLMSSHSPNTVALILAGIYARSGDLEAARTVFASVPADRLPRQRASVLAAMGEHDRALELIEKTLEEDWYLWGLSCLAADPDFDPVRADSRYERIMEIIGQPARN